MLSLDSEKLIYYHSQFPDSIQVKIGESKDGGYWVKILNLPGCLTQVESIKELLLMVNDAVYTYFEIPKKYVPFLPRYFPREEIRRRLQTWKKSIPIEFLREPIQFFQDGLALSK